MLLGLLALCAGPSAHAQIDGDFSAGGGIKLGTSTSTCDGTIEGALRYENTSKCLQLCDGTDWACISVATCADATPAAFDFTDLVNQATSTQVESSILQITDLGCIVNVTISGEGSPEYRTCSSSDCSTVVLDWRSASGTISDDDYLQLRLTTSAIGGDVFSATVNVGTMADVWNATPTGDCTGSPAAGTVCADGTVFAGQSPDGNVKMYVTRCDAGMTWDGTTCSGTRSLLTWDKGTGGTILTGYISQITGETNTAGLNGLSNSDSPYIAAQTCENYDDGNGNTDWYLPARSELNVIYGNKNVIGQFSTSGTRYWTSTEVSAGFATAQRFSDGSQGGGDLKQQAYAVRCTRK